MGLKLRLNLFYKTTAKQVFDAYTYFYQQRGQLPIHEGDNFYQFRLHESENDWVVLDLDGGWEWNVRRAAQLYVSKELKCPGLLIFTYDGDYWGLEYFNQGIACDHFVQNLEEGASWFPGQSCLGNSEIICAQLAHLDSNTLQRYFVHDPTLNEIESERHENESWFQAHDRWYRTRNIKVQPNDEFAPFDECFVLDFLRFLKVGVELKNQYVTFSAPIYQRFWISKQNTHATWDQLYRREESSK